MYCFAFLLWQHNVVECGFGMVMQDHLTLDINAFQLDPLTLVPTKAILERLLIPTTGMNKSAREIDFISLLPCPSEYTDQTMTCLLYARLGHLCR